MKLTKELVQQLLDNKIVVDDFTSQVITKVVQKNSLIELDVLSVTDAPIDLDLERVTRGAFCKRDQTWNLGAFNNDIDKFINDSIGRISDYWSRRVTAAFYSFTRGITESNEEIDSFDKLHKRVMDFDGVAIMHSSVYNSFRTQTLVDFVRLPYKTSRYAKIGSSWLVVDDSAPQNKVTLTKTGYETVITFNHLLPHIPDTTLSIDDKNVTITSPFHYYLSSSHHEWVGNDTKITNEDLANKNNWRRTTDEEAIVAELNLTF